MLKYVNFFGYQNLSGKQLLLNEELIFASKHGDTDLVKELLKNSKVNTTAIGVQEHLTAIQQAKKGGHYYIVLLIGLSNIGISLNVLIVLISLLLLVILVCIVIYRYKKMKQGRSVSRQGNGTFPAQDGAVPNLPFEMPSNSVPLSNLRINSVNSLPTYDEALETDPTIPPPQYDSSMNLTETRIFEKLLN